MNGNIKKWLIELDYGFKNWLLLFFQKALFKNTKPIGSVLKIIVFRTGSIGDTVCALPALSVIRNNFPQAAIDLLTNSGSGNFVSMAELLDQSNYSSIINYRGTSFFELYKQLKIKKYDLFIDLAQYDATFIKQLKTIVFVKAMGIRSAFGWKVSQTTIFKKFQEKNRKFKSERARLLEILKENGLDGSLAEINTKVDSALEKKMTGFIDANKLVLKNKNIGIVIGSKVEKNKWPLVNFESVMNYYLDKGYNLLIFGGKEDHDKAEQLKMNNQVFNFCGSFTPLETAEAMKYCSVVISNDTGPMHLAYMVKTPVVAIFSSRDYPYKWFPPEDGLNKVFRAENIPCSICFSRTCLDNYCMKKTTVQMVIDAANILLSK